MGKNSVLLEHLEPTLMGVRMRYRLSGAPMVREFHEFDHHTRKSWGRARRLVGKAEVSALGDNPRFIVTNLPADGSPEDPDPGRFAAARLHEGSCCGRGDMENRLKQQVLDLKADRLSTRPLGSNQLRLWFSALASRLMERIRAVCLVGTGPARATAGSIRLKLLKVAAHVRISVRRVYVQLSSAWPWQEVFALCARRAGEPGLSGG